MTVLKNKRNGSIAAKWISVFFVVLLLWGLPSFAAAQPPGRIEPPEQQSELYREKTPEFVEMAWAEEGAQEIESFFANEKEDSSRYLLELGEHALFNTSFYKQKKLPPDLVFVRQQEQHKVLWLNERIANCFLANNDEINESQDEALRSLALSWLQVAERQFPKMVGGRRRVMVAVSRRISVDEINQGRPDGLWFEMLPPDIKLRIYSSLARLHTTEANYEDVIEPIRAASAIDRETALVLAEEFLQDWDLIKPRVKAEDIIVTESEGENPEEYEARKQAALEKAKLEEKKRILFESLAYFKGIFNEDESLNPNAVMYAFADCHNPGQIYVRDDFNKLLSLLNGPKDEIVTTTSEIMSARIHDLWSNFNSAVYEDPELAERIMLVAVREGYALLDDKLKMVLDDAISDDPKRWEYAAELGRMRLEAADFYLGLVDLIEPAENNGQSVLRSFKIQRDAALEALELATRLYVETVPSLNRAQYSPQIFIDRFEAVMKLTDIALASLPANLYDEEIHSLRDDLLALEGHVSEGHLEAFVQWFERTYEGVDPKDKYHYLTSFTAIMGDHPVGSMHRRKLEEYENWLQEIQLHVRVDGDRYIGCNQEFGVFLSFRHSTILGQDSDVKYYLAMQEYKSKFFDDISQSLNGLFLIKSIRYHEPGVRSYGYGRNGWQETPLAYLLLVAKDPAVDRISPIELNLEYPPPKDFLLNQNYMRMATGVGDAQREMQYEQSVLLPIRSEVIHVNAYPGRRVARPCRNITITQTLDDRNFNSGEVRITVSARGKGLLPELKDLMRIEAESPAIPGFKITDVRELGTVINDLDSNADLTVDATRSWSVVLTLDDMNRDEAETFHFFAAESQDVEMLYQRYDDAEILTCSSTVRLAWIPPNIYAHASNVLLVGAVLAVLFFLMRLVIYLRSHPQELKEYYSPEEITPFMVVSIIHRIRDDQRIILSDKNRHEMEKDLLAVESIYYAESPEKYDLDLRKIVDQWLSIAREFVYG